MRMVTRVRTGVVALCVAALAATPALVQTSASGAPAERAAQARPDLTFKIAGKSLTVRGAKGLQAGRVSIAVKGTPGTVSVVAMDKGYTFRQMRRDYAASNKGDMKALRRVFAKVDFLGGLSTLTEPGTATVVLPRAGTYTAFIFGGRGPTSPVTLRARARHRVAAPDTDGRVLAREGHRWGGSAHFPTEGTLLFKNKADQPHFLLMMQVKEGTTQEQVMEALQSEGPPDWILPGYLETDALSPGRSMTVDYRLPPGQYVQLCFVPDPTMKGMPHAMMGMVRMVHVM